MFVASVTTNMSQRINELPVHLPAPVTFILSQLAILTRVGFPWLLPIPLWQTLAIFIYAMVSCLIVNDAVKVAMIKWRVLAAVPAVSGFGKDDLQGGQSKK